MTLSTNVYLLSEANVHEVFHRCRRLLGCQPHHAFTDSQEREYQNGESFAKPGGYWTLENEPGQGLPAWLLVHYRPEGVPLRTPEAAAQHDEDCEPGCDGAYHQTACWIDIDFDTSYGYHDEHGGCGELHARLVAQLGAWLDARGIRWSWKNEFTGDTHGGSDKYGRLAELCNCGAESVRRSASVNPAHLPLPSGIELTEDDPLDLAPPPGREHDAGHQRGVG